jgi:hypothetical protein
MYILCSLTLSGPNRWETDKIVSFLHINFSGNSGARHERRNWNAVLKRLMIYDFVIIIIMVLKNE